MDTSATRFLQQENIRLKRENEALKQKNKTLYHYLDIVKEIYQANQEIPFAEKPLDVLDQLLYQVINTVGAKDGSLSRLDEETGELVFVLVHGDLREQLPGYRLKGDAGVVGWAISNQKPIIVNNPRQDWRFSLAVDQEFSFSTRSIVCAPVLADNKPIGVIELVNKQDNEFTEADVALLLILNQVAAAVLQTMPPNFAPRQPEEGDDLFGD
ncbi:MAG: GAF domain-containing protein [Anaerolineae bacterium]|nr:GAF domain-containing protein [Anaerolineae bacterium]